MADLRALLVSLGAWLGALVVLVAPGWAVLGGVLTVSACAVALVVRRVLDVAWLAPLAAGVAVAGIGALHQQAVVTSPVTDLAEERAVVDLDLTVTSDARPVAGRFGDLQVLRARVEEVSGRGSAWKASAPVVVLAPETWPAPALGTRVRSSARLVPADGDEAALVMPIGSPTVIAGPGPWWEAAAAVRASVRAAVSDRGVDERELVPALVDGDDQGLDPGLAEDFRTTGLTHLLAVSGTNLTLVVGFLVIIGRWAGMRGRVIWALAALGIVGFVVVARTEPSVVRAAAMGTVALIGMGRNGRSRGTRCLGVAVLFLLLLQPALAVTAGFALSVLATAGILLLAPPWRDALTGWLPRWAAEAVAVPLAAQVACTPVVAAISGEVSLVAVVANLLATPAVAPATVLGLAGGLLGLVWAPLGEVVAAPAAWSVGWIIAVARRGADLPTPALAWGHGPVALALLTVLCMAFVAAAPRLMRHPASALGCTGLLVVAVLVRPPTPGWPAEGWVLAMCDVGQGDGLVIRSGPSSGVVVDAGPEPALMDECLDRLDVTSVPLVVLTHFHADHVDGLPGVLAGRLVGAVVSTTLAEPAAGAAFVRRHVGGPPGLLPFGASQRVGEVSIERVWPPPEGSPVYSGEGSAANDASVVLLAEVSGVRILLTGDIEPPTQGRLESTLAGLRVDVVKVPHHGSRHQDLPWLTSLGARAALVSVGADNDYGHPAADVLSALTATGAHVWRTDLDGTVLVVEREGHVGVVGDD